MRRLLPLALVLTACPKPSAPAASGDRQAGLASTPAVEEVVAVPLGGLDTPYGDADQPVLEGDRTALDLKSLQRSQLDYTLQLESGALASLTEDDIEALIAHLASDPRWRVYEDEELLLATRRVPDGQGGWTVPGGGYHPSATGPWRVALRFDPLPDDHPWATSDFVARVPAGASEAVVEGFVPHASVYEGNVITALSVEGEDAALDIYESAHEDGRDRTAAALAEVPALIHNTRMLGARVVRTGFEPMLLPPGEPARTDVSVQLFSPGPGELEWRGRLAPPEPGWVWLRLRDGRKVWEDVAVVGGTREAIGWSEASEHTFYAQGRFRVPSGEGFDGTAEVWFLPRRGDARILHEVPVRVPTR